MYVQGLQELLLESFLSADLSRLTPQTFMQLERFYRTVSATLRAKRALKQLLDEQSFLPDLARQALPLSIAEFTDRRISPYAYYGANSYPEQGTSPDEAISPAFVPHLLRKNRAITACDRSAKSAGPSSSPLESPAGSPADATDHRESSLWDCPPFGGNRQPSTDNSPPSTDYCSRITVPCFSLTSDQWSLLEPVLSSLRSQLAAMGIRARTRPFPDRFLLECILTRLAFGYSWEDLRSSAPVRACQVLYKQLCTSGCMRRVYEILHAHLGSDGEVDLLAMSRDGAFTHAGGHIFLTANGASEPPSWEQLTGLLMLQRALYNRRRIQRAETNERHRRGRYEREPSLARRASSSRRSLRNTRRPRSPVAPFSAGPASPLISILDCRLTNPLLAGKLTLLQSQSP
jgi:hypothetical protein